MMTTQSIKLMFPHRANRADQVRAGWVLWRGYMTFSVLFPICRPQTKIEPIAIHPIKRGGNPTRKQATNSAPLWLAKYSVSISPFRTKPISPKVDPSTRPLNQSPDKQISHQVHRSFRKKVWCLALLSGRVPALLSGRVIAERSIGEQTSGRSVRSRSAS
jgi:hypothetical protein